MMKTRSLWVLSSSILLSGSSKKRVCTSFEISRTISSLTNRTYATIDRKEFLAPHSSTDQHYDLRKNNNPHILQKRTIMTEDSSNLATQSSFLSSTLVTFACRLGYFTGGVAIVVAAILYMKQDNLLYFPTIGGLPKSPRRNPRGYRSPSEYEDLPFESIMMPCPDGVKIHSWLIFHDNNVNKQVPTVIFFHGNAGNIGLRLPNAIKMSKQLRANVLLVEYRGYGDSESHVGPSEKGLRLDAEAALQFCQSHPRIDLKQVFLFGRSLGGAVAFHLADFAQRKDIPLAGVIVENTFTSISAMVDQLMPFLTPIKALVLRIGWDSTKIAPYLETPTLYMAGGKDELVPHEQMLELFQLQSTKPSRLVRMHVVPEGTHNDTHMHGGQPYWDAMKGFVKAALSHSPEQSSADSSGEDQCLVTESNSDTVDTDKKSAIPTMSSRFMDIVQGRTMEDATKKND
ncbi:uncharacterized protein FisN_11Lh078 [Fistulifera solaris]|uniref:Serine aminopeptidase S33 domain-containing protein n=1 Tax=Fistulifera solaris TaxID=1519565 RepID=A0A1Z5J7H1_FISSO|nr:uncharacterized protein FisN_11Lh078 [Fistulifera solaris]|eukprot:GAX09933.1 uncharacterized protein FisN_11Lh078 [Fistulifera solaris]